MGMQQQQIMPGMMPQQQMVPMQQQPQRPQWQPVPQFADLNPEGAHWIAKQMIEEDRKLLKRDRGEEVQEPEPEKTPQDLEDYQQRIFLEQLAEKKRKLQQKAVEKEQREKEQRERE